MKSKLIIISVDALQTQDLKILRQLPTFKQILEKASVVKNIQEVYPTLTNVNHVSIITGVTPSEHGVFHNQYPYVPTKENDWNTIGYNWIWEKSAIKVPTLVDAANEAGYITAVAHWPTMGAKLPITIFLKYGHFFTVLLGQAMKHVVRLKLWTSILISTLLILILTSPLM